MRRRAFLTGAGLTVTGALGSPAIASGKIRWNIASAFPKDLPGVGANLIRYAELVAQMSDGRITFDIHGAGELVDPFRVAEAVATGRIAAGHSPSYYAAEENPALHWFTGVPFGMTSNEHVAWLRWGGGQEIWDDICARRNLKPLYSGNSNTQSGGWFRKRIERAQDLKGLNMRIAGLGANVMRQLGVNPVLLPAIDIVGALRSGRIDAAEWVGPMLDQALGLHEVSTVCYIPAFAEPGAAVTLMFNLDAWSELSPDLQTICEAAAGAAALEMQAQFDYGNAVALQVLSDRGIEFLHFPQDVVTAMREAWNTVRDEIKVQNVDVVRVLKSYETFLAMARTYSDRITVPLLTARGSARI